MIISEEFDEAMRQKRKEEADKLELNYGIDNAIDFCNNEINICSKNGDSPMHYIKIRRMLYTRRDINNI